MKNQSFTLTSESCLCDEPYRRIDITPLHASHYNIDLLWQRWIPSNQVSMSWKSNINWQQKLVDAIQHIKLRVENVFLGFSKWQTQCNENDLRLINYLNTQLFSCHRNIMRREAAIKQQQEQWQSYYMQLNAYYVSQLRSSHSVEAFSKVPTPPNERMKTMLLHIPFQIIRSHSQCQC